MSDLLLVFTRPVPGQEAAYHDWYDNQHLGDVLDVPGVVAAQRFVSTTEAPEGAVQPEPFLAVYELEDDPTTVLGTLAERVGSGQIPMSPALDVAASQLWTFHARGNRLTKQV